MEYLKNMRAMFPLVILLLLAQTIGPTLAQTANQSPPVATSQGTVIGEQAIDGNYFAYYGIPYAGDTSGANRFKAPPPAPNFPGEFHAIDASKRCVQAIPNGFIGDENCLALDIYTQSINTSNPVIVWIDGDEYKGTHNVFLLSYKGLVEQGNVVVKLNYRQSVFGFLCLGVDAAPGNAGLRDVIAGLRWIQQNIGGFGGDPGNIVLFGHGSGAAVADLVSLSPLADNLVHKAIIASGSAISPWAVDYNPIANAQALGQRLGYSTSNLTELAVRLAGTELTVLINTLNQFKFFNNTALFAPCIENLNLSPNDTVLSDAPLNILRSGNYRHIPYLTGYVNREGTKRAQEALFEGWLTSMNQQFDDFIQADLGFSSASIRSTVVQRIREFYFSQQQISMSTFEDFLDYQGDTMIAVSVIRNAWERSRTSNAPVRLYQFGYRGTQNSEWTYTVPLTGAQHGTLIKFIFDYDLTVGDATVRNSLLQRFSSFALSGNPNIASAEEWQPVGNSFNYLIYSGEEVSPNVTVSSQSGGVNPHQRVMEFWNDIYNSYYVPPTPVSSSNMVFGYCLLVALSQMIVKLF